MLQIYHHPGPNHGHRPLLIAHGLFGSGRNWGGVAKALAADRDVYTVDMRNHGQSFWNDAHTYPDMAADLAQVIDHIGGPVDLLGHSMGGKAAMVAALNGAHVARLIVADIAPVTYGHSQQPFIAAMQGLNLSQITTRAQADAALAQTVDDPGIRAFLLQSLDIRGQTWQLNLDTLARNMDHIIGFPDIPGTFDHPALFLSGGQSDYVLPQHRDQIKTLFPKARMAKIKAAGHWLHAEDPQGFVAAVRMFLGG
ncbi:MAG: alpha/beta fold hydrolase [Planktomarina sp.]